MELGDEESVCLSAADGQRAHVHLRRLCGAERRRAVHGGAETGRPGAGQPPRARLGRNHRHPRHVGLHTALFVKPHVTSQHRRRTGTDHHHQYLLSFLRHFYVIFTSFSRHFHVIFTSFLCHWSIFEGICRKGIDWTHVIFVSFLCHWTIFEEISRKVIN